VPWLSKEAWSITLVHVLGMLGCTINLLKLSSFFVCSELPRELRMHSSKVWNDAIYARFESTLSLNIAF
jgi:hypothetical protein